MENGPKETKHHGKIRREFVDLLDFSEEHPGEGGKGPVRARHPVGAGRGPDGAAAHRPVPGSQTIESRHEISRHLRHEKKGAVSLEIRYGSTYLQSIAVLIISVAFIILGLYPSPLLPEWLQVGMIFAAAAVLLGFGEYLFRGTGTALFGKGLVFGGVKIGYSAAWSLYFHFGLVGLPAFSVTMGLLLFAHYGLSFRYRSELLHSSAVLIGLTFLSILFEAGLFGPLGFLVLLMALSTGNLVFACYRDSPTVALASGAFTSLWLVFHTAGSGSRIFEVAFRPVEEGAALAATGMYFAFLYTLSAYFYRRRGWLLGMFARERWPFRTRDLSQTSVLLANLAIFTTIYSTGSPAVLMMTFTVFLLWNFYLLDRGITTPAFFRGPLPGGAAAAVLLIVSFRQGIISGFAAALWALMFVETSYGYTKLGDLPVFLVLAAGAAGLGAALVYGQVTITIFSLAAPAFIGAAAFIVFKRESVNFAVGTNLAILLWLSAILAFNSSPMLVIPFLAAMALDIWVVKRYAQSACFLDSCLRGMGHEFTDALVRWKVLSIFNLGMVFAGTALVLLVRGAGSGGGTSGETAVTAIVSGAVLFPLFAVSFTAVYFLLGGGTGRLAMPLMLHFFGFLTAFTSPSSVIVLATLFSVTAALFVGSGHRYDSHLMIMLLVAAACLPFFEPAAVISSAGAAPLFWMLFAFSAGLYFAFLPRFRGHLILAVVILVELVGLYASVRDTEFAPEGLLAGLCLIYLIYSVPPWRLEKLSDSVHFRLIRWGVLLLVYSALPLFYYTGEISDYTGWFFHGAFSLVTMLHISRRARDERGRYHPERAAGGIRGSAVPGKRRRRTYPGHMLDLSLLVTPLPAAMVSISVGAVPYLMTINVLAACAFLLRFPGHLPGSPGHPHVSSDHLPDSPGYLHVSSDHLTGSPGYLHVSSDHLTGSPGHLAGSPKYFPGSLGSPGKAPAFHVSRGVMIVTAFMLASQHFLHLAGKVTPGFLSTVPRAIALDLAAAGLAIFYAAVHFIPPGFPSRGSRGQGPPGRVMHWEWIGSTTTLLLLTMASASFSVLFVPLVFFAASYRKRDLATHLFSGILMIMAAAAAVNMYFPDRLAAVFVLLAITPLAGAILNEARYLGEPFTYGYSTLSAALMIATAWLLGDTFETSMVWAVFSGLAVSAGFYFDKRYLRMYGFMMMFLAFIKLGYDGARLGVEKIVVPMLTFGIMMAVASFFYHRWLDRSGKGAGD